MRAGEVQAHEALAALAEGGAFMQAHVRFFQVQIIQLVVTVSEPAASVF